MPGLCTLCRYNVPVLSMDLSYIFKCLDQIEQRQSMHQSTPHPYDLAPTARCHAQISAPRFPRPFHASYERYPVLTHSALVENPETGETVRLTVSSSFSWLQGIRGNLRLSSTRNPHRTRSISVASRVLSLRHSRTRSMVVILRVQQGHAFHRMGIRFTRYHVDYA